MTDPVNMLRIAKLVGNNEDVLATPVERVIAARLRKIGEKMERKGYLPPLRRQHMARVLRELATRTSGGALLPLCECGSVKAVARGQSVSCEKCGADLLSGPVGELFEVDVEPLVTLQ